MGVRFFFLVVNTTNGVTNQNSAEFFQANSVIWDNLTTYITPATTIHARRAQNFLISFQFLSSEKKDRYMVSLKS